MSNFLKERDIDKVEDTLRIYGKDKRVTVIAPMYIDDKKPGDTLAGISHPYSSRKELREQTGYTVAKMQLIFLLDKYMSVFEEDNLTKVFVEEGMLFITTDEFDGIGIDFAGQGQIGILGGYSTDNLKIMPTIADMAMNDGKLFTKLLKQIEGDI